MRSHQQLIHSHTCGSRSFSKSYSHASFTLKVWWELKRSVGIWDISTVMTSPETQVQKPWKEKPTGASHPTCGTRCPKHRESITLRQAGAHTNVFLSFLLYKRGAQFCSRVFIRMLRAEFCLRYALASQLLIKTCCLWCATSPVIHLFTSLSFYASHIVSCYRNTGRFILNVKKLHTVEKLCLYINYSSACLVTEKPF